MDIHNRHWIEAVAKQYSPFNKNQKLLEIGSWIAPGQEAIICRNTIGPLVGEYIGVDMQDGNGVDVISDAKHMPFPDNSFDVIISTDCYEHVDWPREVTREAFRVMKPGGVFYLTTVFIFQIHGYPDDYWRFTPNCIRLLLEDAGFDVVEVHGCGANQVNPGIVRGIGIKR